MKHRKLLTISAAIVAVYSEAYSQTSPFLDLTAPGDGSVAYFTGGYSGPLTSVNANSAGTIYRIGPQPATRFLSFAPPVIPAIPPASLSGYGFLTDYYIVSTPQFSRDGTVFAYTAEHVCVGYQPCVVPRYETSLTTITGVPGMGTLTANGYGLLSGNGRYVVSPILGNQDAGDFLNDLQTGQGWTTEVPRSSGGRVISDNGVLVALTLDLLPAPLRLIAFSNGTKITAPATPAYTPTEGVIDAAGDIIVYAAKPPGSTSRVLRIFRPGQNQDTLFMQASSDSYAPAIDASGTRVTFISTAPLFAAAPAGVAQLYAINIDGTGLQQLSNANAAPGVVQYALSDDGHVTWYVLGDGALIKLNIDSGVRTFFHPSSVDVSNTVVPGSAVTFYGANLSGETYSAAGSPLPRELGGVRVVLNGVAAPMISVTPTSLIFQAPWETPSGQPVDLQVITHAASESETFAQTVITPVAIAPAPVSLPGTYGGTAIHQDGSGFVTDQNPANAGEVVYLYAMGLGPVAGPMITGLAPIAPANVVTQLSCSFPVLYTGLAPGLPGYYQINILIPPKIPFCAPCAEPTPILYLDCGTNMTALIPTTDPPGK